MQQIQTFVSRFSMMLILIGIHVCVYCAYAMLIPILNDDASIIFGRLLWDVLGILCLVLMIILPSICGLKGAVALVAESCHLSLDQTNVLVGFAKEAWYIVWSVIIRLLTGLLYIILITYVSSKKCAIAMLVLNMMATFAMILITGHVLYKYSVNEIKMILADARRASAV